MSSAPFGEGPMRLVLAVAERGNLSRAAAELGVSQSAASQQLGNLEAALGRLLFRRGGRALVPTIDGEAYLVYARAMVRIGNEARRHFGSTPARGAIRLGLTEDFARTVLPRVLVLFGQSHPAFQFVVECGSSTALFAGLDENRSDLVVAKRRPGRTRAELLWSEALDWHGREAAAGPVGDPVDLVTMPAPSEIRDAALRALREHGRSWRIMFQSGSLATLEAAVAAGAGIAACGRSLRGPGFVALGDAAGLPAIGSVDVVMERAAAAEGDAADAFAGLVREAAVQLARPPG